MEREYEQPEKKFQRKEKKILTKMKIDRKSKEEKFRIRMRFVGTAKTGQNT